VAIDIGLNPVFIFGLGPIPRWYSRLGAGNVRVAGRQSDGDDHAPVRRRHLLVLHKDELSMLRLDWTLVWALVRKGIPMSAQMMVLSLSGILMISIVNHFGVDTAAASGRRCNCGTTFRCGVCRRMAVSPWLRRT